MKKLLIVLLALVLLGSCSKQDDEFDISEDCLGHDKVVYVDLDLHRGQEIITETYTPYDGEYVRIDCGHKCRYNETGSSAESHQHIHSNIEGTIFWQYKVVIRPW